MKKVAGNKAERNQGNRKKQKTISSLSPTWQKGKREVKISSEGKPDVKCAPHGRLANLAIKKVPDSF
jgi:hypothetical protein